MFSIINKSIRSNYTITFIS